jgi:Protein of unknown function (DUF2971)
MSSPWQIFRYRSINDFLWQELELSQFYCCSPQALNDPFDCRIDWRASLSRALASPDVADDRRDQLATISEMFLAGTPPSEAGVCCFTCKVDDPLMWSHYADSHRGVCLLYEIPHDYFMSRYSPEADKDFFFVGGAPVRYQSNAFHDWLVAGDLDSPHPGSVAENALTVLFTVKAPEWGHEEEYRIITRRPGKMAFEPGFLKQVVFGFGTPEQHRRLVTKVARRSNRDVVLSEVRRSSDSDFGLTFPEIVE